jgi:deazaflavin-dependent oxidoreductase (nitroreductase family)
MANSRAFGMPHVPSLIPIINPIIRRLIGSGLPFGPNVLLTVRGRTSGEPRTFPVAILELDGRRYVQSPFGEVNWVRNLRANGEAVLTRRGRREEVDAVELTPDAAGPVLRRSLAPQLKSPFGAMVGRYFRFGDDATPEDDIAEARRHPTFELRARAAVEPAG